MKKMSMLILMALILVILTVTGCGQENRSEQPSPPQVEQPGDEEVAQEQDQNLNQELDQELELDQNQQAELSVDELAQLQVNELGQVMILMYHVIGDTEGEWARTRDNFRQDLQRLYDLGYRTVTLTDFLTNNMATTPGTTPVVFTFDDGTIGHFRFLEQEGKEGELVVDPQSAVGILLEFGQENPDFGHAATFYINKNPFGQPKYIQEKLAFLAEHNIEIGNHSYNHPRLDRLSDGEVIKELALLVGMVQEAVPGYQVNSLALPYGISPKNLELAVAGSHGELNYQHLGVLRVGANPSYPPGHKNFDATRVPRVRADSQQLDRWLEYFEQNPQLRYISDGNRDTMVIPAWAEDQLNKEELSLDKELVIYNQ